MPLLSMLLCRVHWHDRAKHVRGNTISVKMRISGKCHYSQHTSLVAWSVHSQLEMQRAREKFSMQNMSGDEKYARVMENVTRWLERNIQPVYTETLTDQLTVVQAVLACAESDNVKRHKIELDTDELIRLLLHTTLSNRLGTAIVNTMTVNGRLCPVMYEKQTFDCLMVVLTGRITDFVVAGLSVLLCTIRCAWLELNGTDDRYSSSLIAIVSSIPMQIYAMAGNALMQLNQTNTLALTRMYRATMPLNSVTDTDLFALASTAITCIATAMCMQRKFTCRPAPGTAPLTYATTLRELSANSNLVLGQISIDPTTAW